MRKTTQPKSLSSFPPKVRAMIDMEAWRAGISPERLLAPTRKEVVALARFRVWRRQRRELTHPNGQPSSWKHIAKMWGFDHSTVIHGVQRIDKLEPTP